MATATDPCSQHTRASRRGGQIQTASSQLIQANGLPNPRLPEPLSRNPADATPATGRDHGPIRAVSSPYNRAGVEYVMGFCTPEEYRRFLQQCPIFERLLVGDGIRLVKYWFSVSDEEQERRFRSRLEDPLRSWKLSPMDLDSRARWVDYSKAKDEMFVHTDIPEAPWYVVEADDKRRARLNCIHHLLRSSRTRTWSRCRSSYRPGRWKATTNGRRATSSTTCRTTRRRSYPDLAEGTSRAIPAATDPR